MEAVVDFVQMKRFDDPLLIEVLEAMRTPGGKKISEDAWRAITAMEIKEGDTDTRLRNARNWYECAYEWRIVSYAVHANARLNAKAAGRVLYYIPSIDIPAVRMSRKDFDDMRGEPNISTTAKFPGILPVYIGRDMMMQKTLLPPQYVTGTVGKLLGIELHPDEPKISDRHSVREAGCVILKYMPKCFYLEVPDTADGFLKSDNADAPQLGPNVIAIEPDSRTWTHRTDDGLKVAVTRT